MSGNYDYPPASRRTARGSRPSDRLHRPNANRLQHLRDLLSTERNRSTSARALETLNQELEESRSERARDRHSFDQTRAFVDQQIRDLQREQASREDHTHGTRSGPIHPGLQRLQNLDAVIMNHDPSPSGTSRSINRASRSRGLRSGDRSSRGRRNRDSMLDSPVPLIDSPSTMPLEPDHDTPTDRLRVKRRKLDSDDNRESVQDLRYGQYGQVVPGTLKMELASCDGGTFEPVCETSGPENILLNDSSVYCTKSDRCNLILKHRGEAPFCLKKLVIKAPKSGYDAPIQAGMVFVSMSADDLLARTAQYQIQYAGSRGHRGHRRSGMQPSQEYMNSYRTPLQTLERASLAGFDSPSDSDTDTSEPAGASSSYNTDQTSEFHVTTDYDERSDGTELDRPGDHFSIPQAPEPGRLGRVGTMYPMDDDFLCSDTGDSGSDEDDTSETHSYNSRRRDLQRQVRAMRRQYALEQDELPRRRHVPNTIQPIPPAAPSAPRPGPTTRSTGVGLMKPLTQFFIKRPKSSVSLNFDPPPSGRYILIKLWSPYNAGNIDIQSVVAHGFAGPRFFPAAGLR
ncbi:uncharacterized protein APUU_20633A [Aspergillus puulaauensis]|uniref:Uncharacterized protein n=1 Tax=Aspergillus puulaauensis TaxID=1220207 RepID=A0A7R8AIL4_9EURO|nr:uncharacterized protein APUU_20633A [Aspergillus puulaauensis]BCS20201.1 hypothetical protein APUU_20633A [Aspergillus puulaauensis]